MFPTREALRILSPLPSSRRRRDRMVLYKALGLIHHILVIHTFLLDFQMVVRRHCFLKQLALLRILLQQSLVVRRHIRLLLIFLSVDFQQPLLLFESSTLEVRIHVVHSPIHFWLVLFAIHCRSLPKKVVTGEEGLFLLASPLILSF